MGHRRVVPVQHPPQANGPQAVFPLFPRSRETGRLRPPRRERRGPRPGESQRPPRARSRARAGGADDLHQPEPEETAGAAPRPRSAPATLAGSEFRRARAGAGGAAAALWAAIQCRAFLKRGVWGVAHVGRPSPSDEAPGRRARGHEERVTKTISTRPAASERAAQRARAPPPRRCPAYAGRGCSEGSCCSIRCAAAWRPVVHALPRILPPDYSWVRSSAWEMMLHAASQPCT